MNILMTGGTGFIGRCLVEHLLRDKNNIHILTRDINKARDAFYNNQNINMSQVDISNQNALEKLNLNNRKFDAIIHLAASVRFYGSKRELYRANVEGTRNVLHFSKKNNIKRFIFASSIEAMGTIAEINIPAKEESDCSPICPYGLSKLKSEKLINDFTKKTAIEPIILRFGNVYGAGGQSLIIPIANAILCKNRTLKFLHAYKDIYIHPVYVTDIAKTIIHILHIDHISGTYILAGDEYVPIRKLFELIAQFFGQDIELKKVQNSFYNMPYLKLRKEIYKIFGRCDLSTYFISGENKRVHRAYSIEKAKNRLEYAPEVNLKQGIGKTLSWAKAQDLIKEV